MFEVRRLGAQLKAGMGGGEGMGKGRIERVEWSHRSLPQSRAPNQAANSSSASLSAAVNAAGASESTSNTARSSPPGVCTGTTISERVDEEQAI